MGNYILHIEIDNWPVGWTDAQKNAVIVRIELQLEKWTETFFYEKTLDYRLNGNNKNRLFLPLEAEIATVTNIEICGLALPTSWLDWDGNSVFLNVCGSGTFQSGYSYAELSYRLLRYGEVGIFPRGYNNILVEGTYGNIEFLPIAKEACKILIEAENDPSLYKKLFKSEKIGDYSYAYGGTGYGNVYSGIREADVLIDLLVRDMPILQAP